MFSPKDLERLLNFDMPHHNKSIPTTSHQVLPDYTTKCHYTLRTYTCTHKSFSPSPRISHVLPCLYAVPSTSSTTNSPILSELSPYYESNTSKKRCNNMASKPKEIHINEMCSKCRPHTLGASKKVRAFETLAEEREEVSRKELLDSMTIKDWDGSAQEIERGLKALTLSDSRPKAKPEPALHLTTESVKKVEGCEPMIEQPTDEEIETPSDLQGKKQRWVDVCSSVTNGELAPSAKLSHRGVFSRIFRPFGRSEGAEVEITGNEKGVENARSNAWVKVKDDPAWEIVSDEEGKEKKLWKDEGEWVNLHQ